MKQERFGCAHCWPDDADAAWNARADLTRVRDLIDESHYRVMVLACPRCAQQFVSIMTELIDWKDGEDPMYWQVLPLTDAESRALLDKQSEPRDADLRALGSGRRCLRRDYPKDSPERTHWGQGIAALIHD